MSQAFRRDSLSRFLFSDGIFAGRSFYVGAFILLLLKATCYWMISFYLYPQASLDVMAVYRQRDDLDYYPQIAALADFNFGEAVLYEYAGTSIRSHIFVSLLIHAICYKLLGSSGFILADIIATFSYFIVLSAFFRVLRVPPLLAMSASLLIISNVGSFVIRHLCRWGGLCLPVRFWHENIPRPFVSEIFMLLFLMMVFSLALHNHLLVKRRWWVLFGVTLALLIQSDIYQTFILLLFSAGVFFYLLGKLKEHRIKMVQNLLFMSCTAFLLSIPFLVQRLVEHPDVQRRFGAFPLTRSSILVPPDFIDDLLWFLLLCSIALLIYRFILSKENPVEAKLKGKALLLMCGVCLVAILSCTLWGLILGKGIQLEHFGERTFRWFAYASVLWLLYIADYVIKVVRQRSTEPEKGGRVLTGAMMVGISLLFVLCAARVARDAYSWAKYNGHVRPEFKEWARLPGYKNDFIGLVDVLNREGYTKPMVLGTFDHQISNWWLTFRQGYSFVVDPFNSMVPDEVSEARLIAFCKVLGMSSDDFRSFINRLYVNVFWYGSNKYQASAAYTYAALDDYGEEARERIRKTTVYDSWNIALPRSEETRMVDKFNAFVLEEKTLPRFDLIVLTKDESLRDFTPSVHFFELSYENATFRVWKRKQALTQDLRKNYDFAAHSHPQGKRNGQYAVFVRQPDTPLFHNAGTIE